MLSSLHSHLTTFTKKIFTNTFVFYNIETTVVPISTKPLCQTKQKKKQKTLEIHIITVKLRGILTYFCSSPSLHLSSLFSLSLPPSSSSLLSYKMTLKVAPVCYTHGLCDKLRYLQKHTHTRAYISTSARGLTHSHCCECFSWQRSAELIAVQTLQRSDVMNQSHMHQHLEQQLQQTAGSYKPRPQALLPCFDAASTSTST